MEQPPPLGRAGPYTPCAGTAYCCNNMVYISDHSAPDGAGRTQIMIGNIDTVALQFTPGEPLLFDLGPETEIMCARVSTYWVDNTNYLHRSDLNPAAGPISTMADAAGAAILYTTILPGYGDAIAPGVMDMQLAYYFSSAATGLGPATPEPGRWFNGVAGFFPSIVNGDWFEARRLRVTFLSRSLRPVDIRETTGVIDQTPLGGIENGVALNWQMNRSYSHDVLRSEAVLPNPRIFDYGADPTATALPY
jgi:hypothetical protein